MKHTIGPFSIHEHRQKIKLQDPVDIFSHLRKQKQAAFLFESRSVNPIYGRMSLIGIDPILELSGKNDTFTLTVLKNRGQHFFNHFIHSDIEKEADRVEKKTETNIVLKIEKDTGFLSESQKTRRKNILLPFRKFLHLFSKHQSDIPEEGIHMGVFGAFSYDSTRLFENIPHILPETDAPDIRFFLFDTFIRFDLLKEQSEIISYRETKEKAEDAIMNILPQIGKNSSRHCTFKADSISCDTPQKEFENQVEIAKDLAKKGELFEVLFSRTFSGSFSGDPFAVYKKYRIKNPAPYLFFFDFGEEQLIGASPEMMVRIEKGKVHLRPISGTRPRGTDPISDHENELELLSCSKERAELDMLIDLGRNDIKRICKPGIEIITYRHVEKYSRVMHTIAHITGNIRPEYTALDAIISCQPAGTLTGAPKVQAMIEIEKYEKSRRGYYGGTIGYITLDGNMDTGIIIRSTHIKNNTFSFRVGATLLYDSRPNDEYKETENKAQALLEILQGG
jgi:anthranilate/para-aminobenzoate synthase component I